MSKLSAPAASHSPQASTGLLRAMLALIVFTVLATGLGRWSDVGSVHMPTAYAVETLFLQFEDLDDGGVAIRKAQDHSLLFKVEPGTNGFIRGTLRGLVRINPLCSSIGTMDRSRCKMNPLAAGLILMRLASPMRRPSHNCFSLRGR